MTFTTIVAATDLRPESDDAIRQAVIIAGPTAKVALCHALPESKVVRSLFPQLHGDDALAALELQGWAREELEACLARVGSPEVDVYFDTGAPHVCIVERAKALGAQLIVLGAAEGSLRPSNTAQRVLRASPLPVLIARGTSTGPILAATDLSDPSISAIKLAVRQAEALGRELHVVHVVDLERETGWLNSVKRLSTKGTEAYLARAHEAMDKAQTDLTMLLAKHAPHAKGHIDHGRTASAIGKRAKELGASIVVVATHGRTGVDRALVGSVAEDLAGSAPCAVLIVRHGD